jgi:hypothetical protein
MPCFVLISGLIIDAFYDNPFTIVWLIYVVVPIIDFITPYDNFNLSPNVAKVYGKDWRFLVPLYAMLITDFLSYFYMFYRVLYDPRVSASPAMTILYVISFTQPAIINMVVAHELIHRKESVHKFFGNLILFKALFSHYYI